MVAWCGVVQSSFPPAPHVLGTLLLDHVLFSASHLSFFPRARAEGEEASCVSPPGRLPNVCCVNMVFSPNKRVVVKNRTCDLGQQQHTGGLHTTVMCVYCMYAGGCSGGGLVVVSARPHMQPVRSRGQGPLVRRQRTTHGCVCSVDVPGPT